MRKASWLMALLLMACATNGRPDATQLREGLNLLDVSDPDWGMAVAYKKGDHVVYIETRVGTLKPEIFRLVWPEDSANEMDFRFVDENGKTFYVQRGGDEFVEPSWADDIIASTEMVRTPEEIDATFALAQEAAAALSLEVPVGFEGHIGDLVRIVNEPLPSQDPRQLEVRARAVPGDKSYSGVSISGSIWVDTYLYSASTGCFAWVCTARHSATRMTHSWPNEVFVQNACNHGRCYNGSGMSYHCDIYGYNSGSDTINGETNSNNTAVSGGCNTAYNWNSGGNDHLCNDDASFEMWQARDTSVNTSHGDRGSFRWDANAYYACNCNNSGGGGDCDGDWSRPNCF